MTYSTDYLTKLICASETARERGHLHTGRALDRMISGEKQRLRLLKKEAGLDCAATKLSYDYAREDTSF